MADRDTSMTVAREASRLKASVMEREVSEEYFVRSSR
jgi:hypothetical protein